MPAAAKTRPRHSPTAGNTPMENVWVSKLSRTLRAAPVSSSSLSASPTKKKTIDMPCEKWQKQGIVWRRQEGGRIDCGVLRQYASREK